MSDSQATSGDGSLGDHERRIQELETTVKRLEQLNEAKDRRIEFLQQLLIGDRYSPDISDNVDDVFTRLTALAEGLADQKGTLDAITNIESESTSKDGKISQIITFADRKCDPNQDKIIVTAKEIRGCTGVSLRYAYDLIDSIGESYDWAGVRKPSNSGGSSNGGKPDKEKGLKVDFAEFNGSASVELVQQRDQPDRGI